MAIARAAADFIDDHASLFIGAGVVTHKVLPLLADRSNLALTLHDLAMVATAQRFVNCELRLTGGALDGDSTILTGPDAERSVAARPLDIALIEASGIDREGNLVCADARLAPVFRAALKASKRRVALSYRPKIGEGESRLPAVGTRRNDHRRRDRSGHRRRVSARRIAYASAGRGRRRIPSEV